MLLPLHEKRILSHNLEKETMYQTQTISHTKAGDARVARTGKGKALSRSAGLWFGIALRFRDCGEDLPHRFVTARTTGSDFLDERGNVSAIGHD